jgi:hypothetical protein
MERKDPNRAAELLKETSAIELGVANSFVTLLPVYVRGEGSILARQTDQTAGTAALGQ